MSGSELRLSDLKRHLKPIVDELLDSITNKPEEIEYLIDYALKDLLYPKKRTAKDRIIHNWKHALKSRSLKLLMIDLAIQSHQIIL